MPRSYGRFTTDIWRDPKFRALEINQQWAYFMLGTQTDISAAGMLPLTVKRWSGYSADATPDALSDALSGLVAKRFVVIDEESEELLVRAFAKWDGGLGNRNRRPVVLDAIDAIASPVLRHVMAIELRDMGEPEAVWRAISDATFIVASDATPDAPSTSDRVVVSTSSSPPQPPTHNQQPATPGLSNDDAAPAKRATAVTKPSPPPGAVADIVRRYVQASPQPPTAELQTRVEQRARSLLAQGYDPEKVAASAETLGRSGYADLATQLARDAARATPTNTTRGTADQRVLDHLELAQRLEAAGE